MSIKFSLNGETINARENETIYNAAHRHGVEIPHLCYREDLGESGNCRSCMVEIEGERVLAPSCCRKPAADMKVHSNNERALNAQRMVLELLQSDMPATVYTPDNELQQWADKLGVKAPRFEARELIKWPGMNLIQR